MTTQEKITQDENIDDTIKSLISEHQVILFMKGTPERPQCGFSETVVRILQALSTPFHHVDVMSAPDIRQAIKLYSQWPTIPQLYINGEFIGGCDIVREEYTSGRLHQHFAAMSPSVST